MFAFASSSFAFKESVGKALIPVTRANGADGRVTLTWKTGDVSAVAGKDYDGGEGRITFEHGETNKSIEIAIFEDQVRHFVSEPTGTCRAE